jgi:predicted phosphodiesterase
MLTLHFKSSLLLILILLLSGCAHQTTPSLPPPIEQTPTLAPTLPTLAPDATRPPKKTPNPQGSDASQPLTFAVPSHPFDVILGRPATNSITFSLLAYSDQTLSISYGTTSGNITSQTEPISLKANIPQTFELSNLQPDSAYYYTINNGEQHTFHTARAPGSTFTFTIQADSHLDTNSSLPLYEQTLANQRADQPDFVIDLGDTFMTDKVKPYTDAEPQYWAQRYYLSLVGQDAPLFLVLGNHDGEGASRGNAGEEMSVWSARLRTTLFPNPMPNGFYTGNDTPDPTVGALQDYYAWTWGDALFIVLDPYWFTPPSKGNITDLWNPTLGEAQYRWLKSTLEASDAKWKFIFIHQLIGGYDKNGRGGVEVAPFYEWGGNNADGSYGFDQQRPGWGLPIHPLLVANNVTAVFHGHDHLFVKQELDGIIYQECPQPGAAHANTNSSADYGYLSGDMLPSPGHIRVTVTPGGVKVEYIRSSVNDQENGQSVFTYTIAP